MVQMKVAKCPTDVLSLKNRVIVNPADQANLFHGAKHVSISPGTGQRFVFSLEPSPDVSNGTLGFSTPQRKWAVLSLNQGCCKTIQWSFEFGNRDDVNDVAASIDFCID